MSINSIGGPGSALLGSANLQALPLKTMTMLVMAEVLTTREDSQKQKVEEIAPKNAKIKE